jgi:hypothetical protein
MKHKTRLTEREEWGIHDDDDDDVIFPAKVRTRPATLCNISIDNNNN